jgi:DNA polymerase III sliding clamp (beta) subunit (PCNA family)
MTDKATGLEFPDYEKVIPETEEDAVSITFDPELLSALFASMAQDKKRRGVTLILGKDRLSPITVKVGEQSGVLMPMRAA